MDDPLPGAFLDTFQWLGALDTPSGIRENHSYPWGKAPSTLITLSNPQDFSIGNGLDIYQKTLLPALEAAEEEVLFVTCFWAQSTSLHYLSQSLLRLSAKALSRNNGTKIRVRICFSSRSLLQKVFHTSSRDGCVYRQSEWVSKLGLPPPHRLRGLDLRVKSKFFRPFSIMHPKFVVVDHRKAFMPSCNTSWETWLECCIAAEGPIVDNLVGFWNHFWGRRDLSRVPSPPRPPKRSNGNGQIPGSTAGNADTLSPPTNIPSKPIHMILLPSPHHSNFSLSLTIPSLSPPSPPPTPLNTLLLHLFSTATHSIKILTPNLTSPPVISALLGALGRGVDVSIVTNRRMMILEQIITAGTVTEVCVWKLVRRYRRMANTPPATRGSRRTDEEAMLEEGRRDGAGVGRLKIAYYRPLAGKGLEEAGKCHVKCTVVDDEVVVLGSGNMDRASWYTSQELGIALCGTEVVGSIWGTLERGLEGRVEEYFG